MAAKYVAKEPVGPYDVGDEIPEAQAKIWMAMYKYPPVKLVEDGEDDSQPVVALEPKPETKPEEDNLDFESSLMEIKGIGRRTARDIVKVYPSVEDLAKAVESEKDLPFRDDVVKILEKEFKKL